MAEFGSDVSYYQSSLSWSYTRKWVNFRACDGSFTDPHAAGNTKIAVAMRKAGRLINFGVYVVYRPGMNSTILATLKRLGVPADCVIEVDTESWGGKIRGNHSGDINNLLNALRARQHGRADLVWEYGNGGDLANVHPTRMSFVGIHIAAYRSTKPSNPGPGPMVAWQFTDGEDRWPVPSGWPRSSAPFGRCDHNIFYATPKATTTVTKPPAPKPAPKPAPNPTLVHPKTTGSDMTLFYLHTSKGFSVWSLWGSRYRHVPNPTVLAVLKLSNPNIHNINSQQHAAMLASPYAA